ncbi:MAG: hypothetical protein B6244_01260 [Candidatus Cloacimonetes bacterium 4572_55]|nr:MAG: hypothetical protein B6244_01260 [Candidatus Cloacimonetes bacterium 4572_55]
MTQITLSLSETDMTILSRMAGMTHKSVSEFILEQLKPLISSNDPLYRIGQSPVECQAIDASENTDSYLYGGD